MSIFPTLEDAQATHAEVLMRYCTLSALVADHVYGYSHAADCFCRQGTSTDPISENWRHESKVPQFIEDAVVSAVAKKMRLDSKQVRRLLEEKRA